MSCQVRCGVCLAVMLVALRLSVGWHFFTEGTKKFEPGWTSKGFLQQAVGPLAPLYHQFAPAAYDWPNTLAIARRDDPAASPPDVEAGDDGVFPAEAHHRQFGMAIADEWGRTKQRVERFPDLGEDARAQLEQVYQDRLGSVARYLAGIEEDIVALQHDQYVLAGLKDAASSDEVPYQQERIAAMESEAYAKVAPWLAEIAAQEKAFHQALLDLLPEDAPSESRAALQQVISPDTSLDWIDRIVSWTILGVGLLLLAGLFTRLAALLGAGFLLSVILSQPPWVPAAQTMLFGYQLVELMALGLLVVTPAGRLAGLDFFLAAAWQRCCGKRQPDA